MNHFSKLITIIKNGRLIVPLSKKLNCKSIWRISLMESEALSLKRLLQSKGQFETFEKVMLDTQNLHLPVRCLYSLDLTTGMKHWTGLLE